MTHKILNRDPKDEILKALPLGAFDLAVLRLDTGRKMSMRC